VPVLQKTKAVRGALTIRFARTAVPLPFAVETFVPVLREAAHDIADRIDLHIARQLRNKQ
jgi:hypothetical protein